MVALPDYFFRLNVSRHERKASGTIIEYSYLYIYIYIFKFKQLLNSKL